MAELFIKAFLGHMVGDYLFQTDKMAFLKKQKGSKGVKACLLHCLVYTASVCIFLQTTNWLVWALFFVSHFIIDRTQFVKWWMEKIKGLSFQKATEGGTFLVSTYAVLLVVVDNTFHFLFMWLIIKFLLI